VVSDVSRNSRLVHCDAAMVAPFPSSQRVIASAFLSSARSTTGDKKRYGKNHTTPKALTYLH
jgi:hypothetical protein